MVAFAIRSGRLSSQSKYPTTRNGGGCPVVSRGKTINQERALTAERMREYLPFVVTGLCQSPQTMRKLATTAAIMTGGTVSVVRPPD